MEFDKLEELYDLVRPIELYQRFLSALGPQCKSSNFSKYYDPSHGELHPRLALRFKVLDDNQAKRIIEKIAGDIASEGKLRIFVGPTVWQEEDDVWVKANESASECAYRLARMMARRDSELSVEMVKKKTDWNSFVVQLACRILELSGFRIYIRRQYRSAFKIIDRDLDKIANDLSAVWWSRGAIVDPDAVDAFVHLFLNCTAESPTEAEATFERYLASSAIYKTIFDSRKLVITQKA